MDNPYDALLQETVQTVQAKATKFLGKLLGHYKITESASIFIVSTVNDLLDDFLTVLKHTISKDCHRRDGYITVKNITASINALRGQSIFEGVQTVKQLSSHLTEVSSKRPVVMKEIVLSTKTVWKKGVPKVVKHEYGYTFPFLPQLEQLLNCRDVLHCIKNPYPRLDGVFQDVCDGLYVKYHHLVIQHGENILLIVIYCDDVDPCDGLKSKRGKNNLRLYYWMLLNIHPDKRATLRCVNVIGIVKASVAKKYGNEPFLKDLKEDMKRLGKEGVLFTIFDTVIRFWALLVYAAGDMPAMSNLGGFKETHFALRPCRVCMVKGDNMCDCFKEVASLLRKRDEHEKYLAVIEKRKKIEETSTVTVTDIFEDQMDEVDLMENDQMEVDEVEDDQEEQEEEIQYTDHDNPSINFGINRRSILSEIPGFDVTKCFPQDVLHLLCEGVTELVCRLVLRDVCFPPEDPTKDVQKKGLSLNYINSVILDLSDLGHWNKKRPSIIKKDHLYKKLGQSASQMIVLANLLPIILVKELPRVKLDLLLLSVKILNLAMSFKMTYKDVDTLEALIEDFGNKFKKLYPEHNTTKLHSLVHLPTQVKLFGPLRYHWTFQFEAMHSIFTSYLKGSAMKNPALTAAKRFLLRRNSEILEHKDRGTFLYEGDVMDPVTFDEFSDQQEKAALLELCSISSERDVRKTDQLIRHGYTFKEGVVIFSGTASTTGTNFGRIKSVYVVDHEIVFSYNPLECEFVRDMNCFEISKCQSLYKCVKMSALPHPFPIARFSFTFQVPQRETKAYLLDMNFSCI